MNILETALSQYGVKEIRGESDNQTIVDYAVDSGFSWVNDDETPWCSIFINWCAMKLGMERTKKATARSWLNIGIPIEMPDIGDIVVLKRGNSTWQGHVGIFISFEGEYINLLGGNQSNQVKISKYKKTDILGFRKLRNEGEV